MLMVAAPSWSGTVDAEQGRLLTPSSAAGADSDDHASNAADTAAAVAVGGATQGAAGGTGSAAVAAALKPGAVPTRDSASAAKPEGDNDLRRALRDSVKPVLDDVNHSAVAEAVRGLVSDPDDERIDPAANNSDGNARQRNWEAQSAMPEGDNTGRRARTESEMAADKIKASFLFQALLEEVMPWAIGAATLYCLFYLARFVFALRRRVKADRRERRKSHGRRPSSHNSRHMTERGAESVNGTPTQH